MYNVGLVTEIRVVLYIYYVLSDMGQYVIVIVMITTYIAVIVIMIIVIEDYNSHVIVIVIDRNSSIIVIVIEIAQCNSAMIDNYQVHENLTGQNFAGWQQLLRNYMYTETAWLITE